MKAGSAGSSPDGVTILRLPAGQPLREFLHGVGEAVANLNTTVVGLDAVEQGHEKPSSLNISWHPTDRLAAARKARRFALEAALVRVSEAIGTFIRAMAKLPRFAAVTGRWNKNTSQAEKMADVAQHALGSENYLLAGASLLVHWRNRIVHSSTAQLTPAQMKVFVAASEEIEHKFARLSVERLLMDFEQGLPTLKDVSSLISMTIRLARALDASARELTRADLDAMLDHYGLNARIAAVERSTTPAKCEASVLRLLQAEAPGLVAAYITHLGHGSSA